MKLSLAKLTLYKTTQDRHGRGTYYLELFQRNRRADDASANLIVKV
jgi:hypothetical protein